MTKNAEHQHNEDEQDPSLVPPEGEEGAQGAEGGDEDIGDVEAQARRMGWKPQAEYKGDKSKWVEAAEFVRQAEEDAPNLRRTVHQLQRHLTKTERGVQQILAHQTRVAAEERKRGYEEAMAQLDARLDKAVEDGDAAAARKITKSKTELARQQAAEESAPAAPEDDGGEEDAEVLSGWIKENSWYNDDYEKTEEAQRYESFLARKGIKSLSERLRLTSEHIEKKFGAGSESDPPPAGGRRQAPAMVGRSGHRVHAKPKPQPGSYEALKPDSKADCDAYVKTAATNGHSEAAARKAWLRYATPDMFNQ